MNSKIKGPISAQESLTDDIKSLHDGNGQQFGTVYAEYADEVVKIVNRLPELEELLRDIRGELAKRVDILLNDGQPREQQ